MIEFNAANARAWSLLGPSGVFGLAACELAENDDKFIALTADLCYFSGLNRLAASHPDKLLNIGIAEQNMLGIAAGMAKEGMKPFVTTYATFSSTRVLDQVKVNMGYMNLPIKMVGLTAGFSAGILGATHMATEDVAIMRSIPNMVVLSPADGMETMKAILAAAQTDNPTYIRMCSGARMPIIHKNDFDFEIGKALRLREGTEISIIATGTMVYRCLKAAEMFEQAGVSCEVVDIHTIKPIDKQIVAEACSKKLIVTVEEHNKIGGLGGAVAEVLAPLTNKPPHLILGAEDSYLHAAPYETLIQRSGLTEKQIFESISKFAKELN